MNPSTNPLRLPVAPKPLARRSFTAKAAWRRRMKTSTNTSLDRHSPWLAVASLRRRLGEGGWRSKSFAVFLTAIGLTLFASSSFAQALTGTKNIPGNYATLAAAIADLNTEGVGAGGVTLNLIAGNPQTAPAGGYVVGGIGSQVLITSSAANPVIIQGNNNIITAPAPQAVGQLHNAIFKLIGADWITIQGFEMLENIGNTITVAATNNMTEWGVALLYVATTDGAQNNTIQNNLIDLNRTYQNTFGIYSNSTHAATAVTASATATGANWGKPQPEDLHQHHCRRESGYRCGRSNSSGGSERRTGHWRHGAGTANNITNFGTTGTFSAFANVSAQVNGILVRNTKNFNVSRNTVTSSNGGTTAGTLHGIQVPASSALPTGTLTQTINNNSISLAERGSSGAM